jgi:hypothetical protein
MPYLLKSPGGGVSGLSVEALARDPSTKARSDSTFQWDIGKLYQ